MIGVPWRVVPILESVAFLTVWRYFEGFTLYPKCFPSFLTWLTNRATLPTFLRTWLFCSFALNSLKKRKNRDAIHCHCEGVALCCASRGSSSIFLTNRTIGFESDLSFACYSTGHQIWQFLNASSRFSELETFSASNTKSGSMSLSSNFVRKRCTANSITQFCWRQLVFESELGKVFRYTFRDCAAACSPFDFFYTYWTKTSISV